jgi:serine/threonine-protein kinase
VSRAAFWKKDWFLGLAVAAVLFLLGPSDLLQSLERKAYDLGVRATERTPSERIAVIAIDDASIANIGRWPWPRDVHAKMADRLKAGGAKVVGNLVFFSEPHVDPGLAYVNRLLAEYQKAVPDPQALDPGSPLLDMGSLLREAEVALDTDRKLSQSYAQAANIVLPMLFEIGDPRGRPDKPLPEYVTRNAIGAAAPAGDPADAPFSTTANVQIPTEAIGRHAVAIGHLNDQPDVDGGRRTEPLVLQHFDRLYPSFSTLLAARSLNLAPGDIKVTPGEGVALGNLRIATTPQLEMHTYFYRDRDGRPAFGVDSFFDVLSGKIPAEKFRDRIVLVGPTAAGLGTAWATPVSPAMSPVMVLAHSVSSILQEHFFVVPPWAHWAELGAYLLVALYLVVALPRLSAAMGAAATALLLVALLGVQFGLMTGKGMWLRMMLPAVLLLVGHLLLTTKRFLVTEAGKVKSDAESAESNRMLALAFQGQGQLDMAWDKFRKVPLDEGVLDNLYNLALDFERKRQFNKAESVFAYMSAFDPKFRDVAQKLSRAKQLSETVILGGGGGGKTNTSMLTAGQVEKPMLGRYQVEKELGKGAMGVVYQGRDPKIGRVVAIKTMALAQEFEADELADVKARFFREAETAGRLNHPNIVTIFDAGEEHDLAYIAMEFLKGRDLVPYTKPGQLLPLDRVVSIAARVADALDYAHRNNVVHRDVKPANIMYEPDSDTVKVTDFGIARITDSSRTKTGMVLGTPSYMSPEQLAGRRIDGRSDLFSLAVSLYQLACGRLPFDGESMAQLMFRIANEEPPAITDFNPAVPAGIVAFLHRALAKDADARFQTGADFAAALRSAVGGAKRSQPTVDISL